MECFSKNRPFLRFTQLHSVVILGRGRRIASCTSISASDSTRVSLTTQIGGCALAPVNTPNSAVPVVCTATLCFQQHVVVRADLSSRLGWPSGSIISQVLPVAPVRPVQSLSPHWHFATTVWGAPKGKKWKWNLSCKKIYEVTHAGLWKCERACT